jgi:hypothetical protein
LQDIRWVAAKDSEAIKFEALTELIGNEHEVGQGIKDSGVPREQIFLTSKLWNTHQPNVAEGLQKTLDALGTDYLDLYVSETASLSCGCENKTNVTISSFTGPSDLFPSVLSKQSLYSIPMANPTNRTSQVIFSP